MGSNDYTRKAEPETDDQEKRTKSRGEQCHGHHEGTDRGGVARGKAFEAG
jgi:hypothetical protein